MFCIKKLQKGWNFREITEKTCDKVLFFGNLSKKELNCSWFSADFVKYFRTTIITCERFLHCRYLSVQSQQWKRRNNMWILFKVNNKNTRTASMPFWCNYCWLWAETTNCSHCWLVSSHNTDEKPNRQPVPQTIKPCGRDHNLCKLLLKTDQWRNLCWIWISSHRSSKPQMFP